MERPMLGFIKKDVELWKMMITIALPIAFQNLLSSLTQMMDTIMLGELGDIPLTASSLANQVFFIFSLFIFGISGGGAILTAQYWGKKELEPIKTIMMTILRIVMVVGFFLMLLIYMIPEKIMAIYSSDPAVVSAGVDYLRIVAPIYLLFGTSCTLTSLFRSVEVVKLAVIANAVTLVTNVSLNYILIFGKFGMPRLELQGAAYATLIARALELTVVLIYVLFKEKKLNFVPKDIFKRNKLLSADLRKYCTPVVINELIWSLGISMQAALFGHMSTLAVSANTIISVVQNLSTLVIFGVANAAAVIIGKTIGMGNMELAKQRAKSIQMFAIVLGIIGAITVLLSRNVMVDFYNVEDATKVLAKQMLYISAVVVFFVSSAGINIVGLLRGGGDAKYSLIIEAVSLWCFSVPLGYIAGLYFQLPVLVVYALFKSDEVVKVILCAIRLASDKWINRVTREE
ncbi:MAG: MATE family efflux transporter [Eubacteriales bacterium]